MSYKISFDKQIHKEVVVFEAKGATICLVDLVRLIAGLDDLLCLLQLDLIFRVEALNNWHKLIDAIDLRYRHLN